MQLTECLVPERILEQEPVHEDTSCQAYNDMVTRHQKLLNKPFIDLLAKLPNRRMRVLDIGTGPGLIPIGLAQKKSNWDICGLDASHDMLDRARTHARKNGVGERVRFIQGDALAIPFEAGHFDLVVSNFVLHHMDHPEVMLNEAARVVRGGGRVVIRDLKRPSRLKAAGLMAFSKYVLGYSDEQLELYSESLAAALTMSEIRKAAEGSKLLMPVVSSAGALDFTICG